MTKAYDAIFIAYNDNKHDPVLKHSRKCQEALNPKPKTSYEVIEAKEYRQLEFNFQEVSHDEDTI